MIMTTAEAANYMGCSRSHIRTLIYTKKLRTTRKEDDCNQFGYRYYISKTELDKYMKRTSKENRGRPRGKTRS